MAKVGKSWQKLPTNVKINTSCQKLSKAATIWQKIKKFPMMKLAILFRTHKATCCSLNHLPTRILMGGHHLRYPLPYPLPGFFSTTLPEPYPKSKSPTRHSLFLTIMKSEMEKKTCILHSPSILKHILGVQDHSGTLQKTYKQASKYFTFPPF